MSDASPSRPLIHRMILAAALIAGLVPAMAQVPAPVPALPDTERRTSYSISASTCACNVNFALYGDSTDYQNWVEVFINGQMVQYNDPVTGWTITSPTGPIGPLARPITDGVLTFNNPQTGTIQIVGARRPRRVSQFQEGAGVPARNLNQVLTDIVAMLREVWDKINDVTGRVVRAPPGETMATLPPAASRAGQGAGFDSSGNLVPTQTIVPTGSITAGSNISLTGTNPTAINLTTGSSNTFKGSLNGLTTSDIALTACTLSYQITKWVSGTGWQCGINVVLPSRAIAATLNLSAFTAVRTLGYATPGDGGEATFANIGTGNFRDTYITGATLVGGTGYPNGTGLGVAFTGGTGGNHCEGSATASGGVITSISIVVPCPGYKVGDVLSASYPSGPTGTGFSYTVTSISTPQASFSDSAGNHWQFVPTGVANILQFGAVPNWANGDSGATNNSPAIWSANAWASWIGVYNGTAQAFGTQVFFPHGAYMTCGQVNFSTGNIPYYIPISQSVRFIGSGVDDTTLAECAADSAANHYIELCDSNSLTGQFGCGVESMTFYLQQQTTPTSGIAAIYSNSGQQFPLGVRLHIEPGNTRGCIKYETGKGGAANAIFYNIDCSASGAASNNPMVLINSPSTQFTLRDSVIENGGASSIGIDLIAGRLIVDGLDVETFATGLSMANTVSGNLSVYRNVQQNSNSCSQAVTLTSTNVPGNIMFENLATTCPIAILNGQSGGSNFTGSILKQLTCVSGACS